jgi:hypothetical protein
MRVPIPRRLGSTWTSRSMVVAMVSHSIEYSSGTGYTTIAATIRKIKHDTALLLAILGLSNP